MSFERDDLTQLDFTILQAQAITPEVERYVSEHQEELVRDNIIPEIVAISQAMNMPRGFADGVGYERVSRNSFKIVNDWGTSDLPLALWFNYGTKDHGPKHADRLHWIDKKTGQHIYAKWVRGVPKTHAMEIGIALGKTRFMESLLLQSKQFIQKEFDLVT